MTTPPRKIVVDGVEYWVNGCTDAPNFDFENCCNNHDVDYARGGGPWRRLVADWKLGHCIYCVGRARGWLWVIPYAFLSCVYFLGVRLFGWRFFSWWWGKK